MTGQKSRKRLVSDAQSIELPSPRHPPSAYQKSDGQDLTADDYYNLLSEKIRNLYPEGITDEKCHEATRNFIGFGKLLLEMKRKRGLTKDDE